MNTTAEIASYVTRSIHHSGKSNKQIAQEAGFKKPNFVSMLKKGHAQVPLARIPALAKALGTDPKILLDACLAAYYPEIHKVFRAIAPSMLISSGELSVIRALRHAVRAGAFS